MRALLDPPKSRPEMFYRGDDVYDPDSVGFVSDVASRRGRKFFEFRTNVPGNSNNGHNYGTSLPPEDKTALIEYLKTL